MARPGVEQTHVTMQSIKDNDSGLSNRQQCLGGHAQSIHEGGVSFSTAGGGSLYFPFGYVGQYGQANGHVQPDRRLSRRRAVPFVRRPRPQGRVSS